MAYNTLQLEFADGMATITLDRPPMNAVTDEMLDELVSACRAAEDDETVNVIILTGAGRAFSAGRDVPGVLAGSERPGGSRYRILEDINMPAIAAVNGFCFTGSFELAMCADISIASDKAKLVDTHARVGMVPGGGQTQRLPRLIGARKAKELLFTGRQLNAEEAEQMGIVNKVVPHDTLMDEARAMAALILENIPETISIEKRLINQSMTTTLEEGLALEAAEHPSGVISPTPEGHERMRKLFEK
jgi:enoyl-CoA hydratase/carnithine racemase